MSLEISRSIIEKYFLEPNEIIIEARQQNDTVIVSSGDWQWWIESAGRWPDFVKSDKYQIFEVRPALFIDPPPRPDGVAVLPDGRMFCLGKDNEFRMFFQQLKDVINPLELAGLLANYQGKGPHFESAQNLIIRENDLSGLLEDKQIEAIPDLVMFRSTRSTDSALILDFCTFYISREPPDFIFMIGLNRWHVEADDQGRLEWSVSPIACGLRSSRYSPT